MAKNMDKWNNGEFIIPFLDLGYEARYGETFLEGEHNSEQFWRSFTKVFNKNVKKDLTERRKARFQKFTVEEVMDYARALKRDYFKKKDRHDYNLPLREKYSYVFDNCGCQPPLSIPGRGSTTAQHRMGNNMDKWNNGEFILRFLNLGCEARYGGGNFFEGVYNSEQFWRSFTKIFNKSVKDNLNERRRARFQKFTVEEVKDYARELKRDYLKKKDNHDYDLQFRENYSYAFDKCGCTPPLAIPGGRSSGPSSRRSTSTAMTISGEDVAGQGDDYEAAINHLNYLRRSDKVNDDDVKHMTSQLAAATPDNLGVWLRTPEESQIFMAKMR